MVRKEIALVMLLLASISALSLLATVLFIHGNRTSNNGIVEYYFPTSGTVPNGSGSTPVTKPPINIVEILTIISLTVGIAYGILKITGREVYIGRKKKPPYIIISSKKTS